LNHLDYVDSICAKENRLTRRSLDFVRDIENTIGAKISLLGLGPASLVSRTYIRKVAAREQ